MWTVSYCSLRKMKDLFLSYNMASSNYSYFQQHHLVVVPFLEASYNHSSEGEDAQQSAAAIGGVTSPSVLFQLPTQPLPIC